MKITNKTAAYILWAISFFYIASDGIHLSIWSIISIVSSLWLIILGCALYKEMDRKIAIAAFLLYTALNIAQSLIFISALSNIMNLIIALALIAILYIKQSGKFFGIAEKCWFVPGILCGVDIIIFLVDRFSGSFHIMTALGYIFSVVIDLILGYSAAKIIKTKEQVTQKNLKDRVEKELAFYKDLHNKGVLTDEEFEAKKEQIEKN